MNAIGGIGGTHAAPPRLLSRSWLFDGAGVRLGLVLLILGCTALQRFGVTVGEASFNAGLIAAYVLLALALVGGELAVMVGRLALFCALMVLAGASLILNEATMKVGQTSPTSLVILGVMYLPFVFALRPGGRSGIDADWALRAFANVALLCAWAGIAQFAAQFVIKGDWLFDFSPYLPPVLRSSGGYNVVIPVGDLFKSNGFFFKEPSLFSLALAFGLLIEIARYRRWLRMATMFLALALTYSGSGLIILVAGLLFPLRVKTLLRFGALVLVGGVTAALLWDTMNLGFTLGRVMEFGQPKSSGHMRYVAPLQLIADSLDASPWTMWLGRGPGSITRAGIDWGWFYLYHDPTFAKALFEYGVLGSAVIVALVLRALRAPAVPIQVRAAAFVCWIGTGGFLVTPELTFLMLVFGGLFATGGTTSAMPAASAAPAAAAAVGSAARAAPAAQAGGAAAARHTSHGASPRA